MSETTTRTNEQVLRELYSAFNDRDMERVASGLADDVAWTNPYGTYDGPDDVIQNALGRFSDVDMHVEVDEYVGSGDTVVSFGSLSITDDGGTDHVVPFAHRWELSDGLVTSMRAYPDTERMTAAIGE